MPKASNLVGKRFGELIKNDRKTNGFNRGSVKKEEIKFYGSVSLFCLTIFSYCGIIYV